MKKHLIAIIGIFLAIACGDDGDATTPSTPPTPPAPAVSISLQQQNISNGDQIDAATTSQLTLAYNVSVIVSSNADITLNGARLLARNSDSKTILIPLNLQDGKDYTLQIAEGVIIAADDASVKAPALTLSFKTIAKEEPGPSGNTNISPNPLTASTDGAVKLYQYFVEQYGQKTISSVMANVNWNNDCAEKVYKLTGKYPAMNCYDFIHICYSAPNSWINYADISPVQQWHNAGGIVQLMWHFNVPVSENTTDNSFYSDNNTFKPSRALTNGTWENKWFYEQMDKVAVIILKLQDAGIAATWRPFHEAAGNAIAKQHAGWTKAWFWWGSDGAETYKRLWIAMFDYFKQKGINNLIWVWTTQNYNGDSSKYSQDNNWYPGNRYVDIVARDLYGYNADKNLREFTEIQAQYPNKMVVLGECGKGDNGDPAKMGDAWTKGAKWGHFMVWYQGEQGATDTMCSDAWWKNAMSSQYVITREQLPQL